MKSAPFHWTQLGLLAALPAWIHATAGLPDPVRLGGWLLLAFLVLGAMERLAPFRTDWATEPRALRRDGSVLALNLVADALTGVLLASLALLLAPARSGWPLWLEIPLLLALGELAAYALHRASHRDGWLWQVHLLHHRPDRLNVANALTAHPFNAIYDKLAHLLPALLLGLSPEAILAATLFVLTQGLVVHANVAGTLGPWSRVLGSAELHRLHHSADETEAGNFGTALPWWDLVFGTYRAPQRSPRAVGVFEPARYPSEFALGALLAWPLRALCTRCNLCARACA